MKGIGYYCVVNRLSNWIGNRSYIIARTVRYKFVTHKVFIQFVQI